MAVPQLHAGAGVGAERLAVGVQVPGQQFDDGFLFAEGAWGTCSDLGEPVSDFGLRPLTMSKNALGFLSDGPARAGADLDAVELHGRDFRGGAGEEGLVGDIDLIAGDSLFARARCRGPCRCDTVLRVMPLRAPANRSGV